MLGADTHRIFLPSVPVNNDLNDMTHGFHALLIDNTTFLETADIIAPLSTDGQGETLLTVIDEDLSARYSRLRAEARMLMQAHIVLDIHTLTQYNLSMHSALAAWFDNLCDSWTNSSSAEFRSSSSDDEMPCFEPITSLHSRFHQQPILRIP